MDGLVGTEVKDSCKKKTKAFRHESVLAREDRCLVCEVMTLAQIAAFIGYLTITPYSPANIADRP